MQYFIITTVLAALSTLVGITAGSAISNNGLPFPVVPAQWTGVVNGSNITLSGTASEVTAQLQRLDPSWIPSPVNTTATAVNGTHPRPVIDVILWTSNS